MESLLHDLRFGLRTLLKNPGFTAVAIIALALGTGVNSAIFSVVNAVLLRPLPYANPDRLALIWGKTSTSQRDAISIPDSSDYRNQSQFLDQLATWAYDDFNITSGDEPEHVAGTIVSANYFDVLGINFTRGRGFRPNEDQAGAERVVILADGLWKSHFGSDPDLVGKTIQLNGGPFTVVGIAPPSFQSPFPEDKPQLWTPFSFDGADRLRIPPQVTAETLNDRKNRFLICLGRVKPGVSLKQAQTELETIAGNLEQQYKNTNAGIGVSFVPLREQFVGKIETALVVLLAAVGIVLLIACANVANLLLARSSARQKEIAIRAALGASRFRLIRQLLTESILLAVAGGALGLVLAYLGIKLLLAVNPANIPRLDEVDIDAAVLGFTLLIAVLTGVIFGLAPAVVASRPNLNETLKEGARGSTGGVIGQLIRSLLVVSEVLLTVWLLLGAGLMLKSFYALQKVNPGFNPDNIMTMMVNLPPSKYTDEHQIAGFYEHVLKRIEALPGVQTASVITGLPLTTTVLIRLRFSVDGRPPASASEVPRANFRGISHDYFRTMRVALVKGRYFNDRDRDTSPPVVIINESMANRYWPGEDPVGRHLTIPFLAGLSREIVGVVADVKHSSLDAESGLEMYVPYLQKPFGFMALAVRTSFDPAQITRSVRNEILAVDSSQPVYDVRTMQQVVSDSVSQPRLYTLLLGVFAVLAIVLASVGIYGVMSYAVNQRTHEIGIRMALGAQRGDILKMIVGKAMLLALVGLLIGVVAAFISTRVMENFLFGVSTRDLTTFVVIPLLLAMVAFLSSYIPARRATLIDPMIALRYE